MVLDVSLLNTQHYKERIKGKCSCLSKEVAPPLHLGAVAIENGVFGSPSTTISQLTYIIYIYIYIQKPMKITLT